MNDTTRQDAIVIGAGISGIFAAKFYLDMHPGAQLVILERDNCVGGTWNKRRGYESFWTQWTVGTAEFSDMPMQRPPEEDLYFEFFKAKHTTKYLETYVDQHSYSGLTLRGRIKFSTEVQSVLKIDGQWTIMTKERNTGEIRKLSTSKLIVASGITSIQNMPLLPGREDFHGQVLHHEDFGSSNVLTSPDIRTITVIGGGKSSADMVYEGVKAGKTVSWILKTTDTTGPGFLFSPKGMGPYKNAFEVGMTRFAGTFTPSFLNGVNRWARMLHSSKFGVRLMSAFWKGVDADARKEANFGRESLRGFDKLAPHSPIFWQNCTGGLLNHEDFFETIAKNVRIYSGEIASLEKDLVHLDTGEEITSDVILCGTGWVPSLQFFSEDQCKELGLPHPVSESSSEDKTHWATLEAEADHKVLSTFPQLANPPPHYRKPTNLTPYRLYRLIAPLSESSTAASERSIVFIGQVGVGNYFPAVECQSMFATAYLDGKLSLPSKEEQEKDVALFTTWCRRRYLTKGDEGNNMTFELIGYMDTLLKDLGLRSHRKGWFKDLFAPMWARDLRGLKEEFVKKFGYEVIGN